MRCFPMLMVGRVTSLTSDLLLYVIHFSRVYACWVVVDLCRQVSRGDRFAMQLPHHGLLQHFN